MRIGYARVSTLDQNLDAQLDALKAAGCEYIYMEKRSGKDIKGRPEFQKLLKKARPLDVIVVTKLDRLTRSAQELLAIIVDLGREHVAFVSLAEPWADTSSPAGMMVITIMAGVAQFERARILERCNDGRRAAKLRGSRSGRKCALDPSRTGAALLMLEKGEHPKMVANVFGVNTATIYRMRARAAVAAK